MNIAMSGRKYYALSLKEKIDLINAHECGGLSVKQLRIKFHCGKTQVYQVLKNKDRFKEKWLAGIESSSCTRKSRVTKNEEVNKTVYKWFVDARSRNLPLSGPILQTQAKIIAESQGNELFAASNGWLERFRLRHGISFKKASTKANDIKVLPVKAHSRDDLATDLGKECQNDINEHDIKPDITNTNTGNEQTTSLSVGKFKPAPVIENRISNMVGSDNSTRKLQRNVTPYVDDQDEFDYFGKSVAMQLRKMPLDRALICQEKLQAVLKEERLYQFNTSK